MTWRLYWHTQLDPTYGSETTSKGDNTRSTTTNTCAKRMVSLAHCSLSTIITAFIIPVQIRHLARSITHQNLNTQNLQIQWGRTCKPTPKEACTNIWKVSITQKRNRSWDDESIYACNNRNYCVEQQITVITTHHLPGSVSCLYLPYLYNINKHICQPNAKFRNPCKKTINPNFQGYGILTCAAILFVACSEDTHQW